MTLDEYWTVARARVDAHAHLERLFAFTRDADARKWEAQFNYGGQVLCAGGRPPINLVDWPDGKAVAEAVERYQLCKAEERDAFGRISPEDQGDVTRPAP